jgi:hypothetical protein
MATCPRCFGALTEHHRCPRGRFSQVGDALLSVGVGGLIAATLCYALQGRPPGSLVISAASLGGVLGYAFRKALFPKI